MNILQKLINDTSTSENAFAEMVGVSKQRLRAQLKSNNTLLYAVKYAQQLQLKEISGDYAGSFVNIEIGRSEQLCDHEPTNNILPNIHNESQCKKCGKIL